MQLKWLDSPSDYTTVWQAMESFTHGREATTADEIWLTEHAPVYTLGQAGLAEHILNPHNIPIVRCNRGGQVTYHGPGQVVMYTLIDLRRQHIFVREFVSLLEQTVLGVLESYGIRDACRKQGAPGIYVPLDNNTSSHDNLAKIAALGLKVSKGCVYHGLALNVDMDLSPFDGINPCGYAGLKTVDMKFCGISADPSAVGNELARKFFSLCNARNELL